MQRAVGGLILGAVFAASVVATLVMDGSGHYPLSYPQVLLAAIALLFLASAAIDRREARRTPTRWLCLTRLAGR